MDYFPLEFSNISVIDAPFLKDYYWQSMRINDLNDKLLTFSVEPDEKCTILNSPIIKIPSMPIHSNPIKIILHICNTNLHDNAEYTITRVKLCDCEVQQTQVGINHFKMLYNCPHRSLLELTPRRGCIKSKRFDIIELFVNYTLCGRYLLKFEMRVTDKFILNLIFEMNINEYDPIHCVITNYVVPVKLTDYESFYQPIWLYNPYGINLPLDFSTRDKGLKIITPFINMPRHGMRPLIIKYKPNIAEEKLTVTMSYRSVKTNFIINGRGSEIQMMVEQNCPKNDIPCEPAPYTIFENTLSFNIRLTEDSTQMIAIHNNSSKCVECRWLKYELPNYFDIDVYPSKFLCKPQHPVLCLVRTRAKVKRCIFHHIPVICEIHHCKSPPLQTDYEELHSKMESIDDPKIFEPTLLTKLYINVNLLIEGLPTLELPTMVDTVNLNRDEIYLLQNFNYNHIEKVLWKNIFNEKFLHVIFNRKIDECTYDELMGNADNDKFPLDCEYINKKTLLAILRYLTSGGLIEMSKSWRFIPKDIVM